MAHVAITGCSSGLGRKILRALQTNGHRILQIVKTPEEALSDLSSIVVDLNKPFEFLNFDKLYTPIDVLINCAGVNYINYLENASVEDWDAMMNVNARAPFLLAKLFLPQLIQTNGTILNIVSNASHMPMTASAGYNASKGALHILTLQLARELSRRYGITVFGISPNKLRNTGMSADIDEQVQRVRGWTAEEAKAYQLSSLLAGEETDPNELAKFIAYLLDKKEHHKYLTGCVIPYGA